MTTPDDAPAANPAPAPVPPQYAPVPQNAPVPQHAPVPPFVPAPPQYAPAAPPPLPADATQGGLAFHRLVFARKRYGWWTPLVTGLVGVGFYIAFTVIIIGVTIVLALADPAIAEQFLSLDTQVAFDLTNPLLLAILLLSIVVMLPSYLLASRLINGPKAGFASSAAGRLRWGWMLLCAAAAVGVAVVLSAVLVVVPVEEEIVDVVAPEANPAFWISFVVLLLLVPLQSAAEEYVFRGYLMQAIGRWLRHPLFAILLPVPLFVLGHLYDPVGQLSVGVFAVAAGWLSWRTGGLEAAIALHVVNNLMAFMLALWGLADVNDSSPGWIGFVQSIALIGAYCGVIEWLFRTRRLGRTVIVTPPVVPPPAPYAPIPPAWQRQPMSPTPQPSAPPAD